MNTIDELYATTPIPSSSNKIRLLTVLQATSHNEELRTYLTVGDLKASREFYALSYVWTQGSGESRRIKCGSSTLTITANCHSALIHLRKKLGSYVIWVDAICINQKDDLEKAHQISLMGLIYSKARNVYVWLGDSDATSDRAMAFLNGRGSLDVLFEPDSSRTSLRRVLFSIRTWSGLWKLYCDRWRIISSRHRTAHCQPVRSRTVILRTIARYFGYVPATHELLWYRCTTSQGTYFASVEDLSELFSRPWMRRMWTYQEIIMANSPIVMCGDRDISWEKLASKVMILEFTSNLARWDSRHPLAVLERWRDVITLRERLGITSTPFLNSNISIPGPCTDVTQSQLMLMYNLSLIYYWVRAAGRLNLALWYTTWLCILFTSCLCTWFATSTQIGDAADLTYSQVCEIGRQTRGNLCSICHHYWPLLWAFIATSTITLLSIVSHILGYFVSFPSGQQNEIAWIKRRIERYDKTDLVNEICHRQTTKPLDKSYALHAMLEHLLQSRLSTPDYNRSRSRVYKKLGLDLMRATRSMEVLLAAAVRNLPEGPSWVADWSADFPEYWMRPSLMYQTHRDATFGSTTFHRNIDREPDVLIVRGLLLCTVDGCIQTEITKEEYDDSEKAIHLSNLGKMRQFHDSWFPPEVRWWVKQHLRNPFNRSIPYLAELRDFICNPLYHTRTPTSDTLEEMSLAAYWKFLFYWSPKTDPADLLHLLTKSKWAKRGWYLWFISHRINGSYRRYRRAYVGRSVTLTRIMLAHIAVCNTMARTRKMFFYTEDRIPMCTHRSHVDNSRECHGKKNTYIKAQYARVLSTKKSKTWGICKSEVQIGDKVVLVAGLKIPLVLRPDGQNYRIISPAVVVGIMQGQAWPCNMSTEEEEEQLQYFRLV